MSSIIAVMNHKGGTSKTTTAASLAVALIELGQKPVLLIDSDHTRALSTSFGVVPGEGEKTLYEALLERGVTLKRAIRHVREGLDLVPASRDLSAAEILLSTTPGGDVMLQKALQPVRADYAMILIDCPPALGKLTINALTAADGVLVPVTPAYLSLNPLEEVFATIEAVKERLNPRLRVLGILLTQFNQHTLHHREVEERVRTLYPDLLFPQIVPWTIRLQEAPAGGQTILDYQPSHPAAMAHREAAKEVLQRAHQAH